MGVLLPSLGVPELLLVLLIVVLIFGSTKLPQLGKGLGEAIRNFKQGVKDENASPPPDGSDKPKV